MGIRTDGVYDGVITNGHSLILIAEASTVADYRNPTITELSAETTKDGTYEFKTFEHTASNDEISDERHTIPQVLTYDGGKTDTLTSSVIFGNENATIDAFVKVGTRYVIYVRDAVPHDTPLAEADKFEAHPVRIDRKPTGERPRNAVFTRTLNWKYWDEMLDEVTLAGPAI